MGCNCCLLNDYDPHDPENDDPEDQDLEDSPVPGSCLNCGHSPEEHLEPEDEFLPIWA